MKIEIENQAIAPTFPALYAYRDVDLSDGVSYYIILGPSDDGKLIRGLHVDVKNGKLSKQINTLMPLSDPSWLRLPKGDKITFTQD